MNGKSASSNTSSATNWLKTQWNDIKGNAKFALIMALSPVLFAGVKALINGIPVWKQVVLLVIFVTVAVWAIAATVAATRKPQIIQRSFEVIDGYDNVYDRTLEVIRTAKKWGRAAVYANNLPLAPERFVEGLVNHLVAHPSFKYHVTFIANLAEVPAEFWMQLDLRLKRMREARVEHQFRITFIDAKNQIGFDVLVLDDIHCCMGFSPIAPMQPGMTRQSSFIFENQPSIAERVHPWLDNLYPLKEVNDAREIWEHMQRKK